MRIWRALVPALVLIEGVAGAVRLAGFVQSLAVYGPIALTLLALRGLVCAMQITGGWWLAARRPTAPAIVRVAMLASLVLTVAETGFRLAPTSLDPTFRWWAVAAYAVYALAVLLVRFDEESIPR